MSPNQNPATKNKGTPYTVGRFEVEDADDTPPTENEANIVPSPPPENKKNVVQVGRFEVEDVDDTPPAAEEDADDTPSSLSD